jgi:hypothetical protein
VGWENESTILHSHHERALVSPQAGDAVVRRILLLIVLQVGLLANNWLFADVVTMNDGHQVSGAVESGNTQEIQVKAGVQVQTLDIHQVRTIQFGTPAAAPPPPKESPSASEESAHVQADSLIFKDGTRVGGRWWSIDTNNVHFLVNNQLQQYPRASVLAVTLGGASLPPPPATSKQPAVTPAQPSSVSMEPVRPPASARSPGSQPPEAPKLARGPAGALPAPSRGVSQPEEIGAVYFWNGKNLTPLEHNQAVEHGRGSNPYWEMPGAQSRVRLKEAPALVFILRLPKGVDPAGYSLFSMQTVNGARRTRSEPSRRGGLVTWPFAVEINDESGYMTYALTVKDLPEGEYSFSPSSSNDGYSFGVDTAAAGQ